MHKSQKERTRTLYQYPGLLVVGIAGLEPASPKTGDFKSPVSANFTISPGEMKKTVFLAKHRFLWYTIRDSNPGHPD